ncbi:hypothetical protein [Geomobilimonas luticola]|uniref:Glycosyltransferase RgtA/B/C/D-like domain-containing protein n=1 Tax=Geomobilimonas luticola TaxID=1114878 RepID=A0ABS5SA91_9BACT|nr:hypothetical protein [Geomobilimonas luticola]MBT0652299.1 hypothetical protein [Geomobilimonas luticola]
MVDNQVITNVTSHPRREGWWRVPAWLLFFTFLVCLLQWYIPHPLDDDTAYHFSVGQLMARHGILHNFPWTPFSWQFDHYADKEFLFHLLFVPLGGLGLVNASRVVGVVAGTLILSTLYLILRSEKVMLAGVWALIPLGASAFVYRFAMVRPHLLSIALALIVLWACARGRLYILACAAVIYPLAYVAFWQIPLILLLATESSRLFTGERLRWKPAVTLLAGIVAGVLLHPNTANLLGINWIHMADILFRNAWGEKVEFSLGTEFNPFPLSGWCYYLLVALFMAAFALVLAWRERRQDSFPLACAIATMVFGLLTVKSGRFLEYFVPCAVLSLAVTTRHRGKRFIAPVLLGISLLYTLLFGTYPYTVLGSLDDKAAYLEPATAEFFAQQVPVGAQVFTTNWDYTGNLMVALPERQFLVAADPTLFYKKDSQLYALWQRLLETAPPDAAEQIRRYFSSRFVISRNDPKFWPFFDALANDSHVKCLFADKKWVMFDLGSFTGPQ